MEDFRNHPLYKKHTLDSAMDSLWVFYKSHFLVLFLISFVVSLAMQFFAQSLDYDQLMGLTEMNEIMEVYKQLMVAMIPVLALTVFVTVLLNLYVLRSPSEGNKIMRFTLNSFKYLLTYVIIMILAIPLIIIAMAAGLIALIIGIFFSVIWLVALFAFVLPILMAEGNDITNAITGSFRMLHRNFWSNMGWTAVFVVILVIVSFVMSGLALIPFAGSFLQTLANPDEATHIIQMAKNPIYMLMSAALNSLTLPLFPIFSFILYFNAKAREEVPPVTI
jgi:hypothetical protein